LPRLALLIDAENVQLQLVEEIFAKASEFGTPVIRRAYACYTSSQVHSWRSSPYARIGVTPIHVPSVTKGKNAADISLAIDAMEIAMSGKADVVCIVTSDGDFSMLGHKLREHGVSVLGVGDQRSPDGWRGACDTFLLVDQPASPKKKSAAAENANKPLPPRMPMKELAAAVVDIMADRPTVALAVVGHDLKELDPHFTPKRYGFKNLSGLVGSLSHYGVALFQSEGEWFVRQKRHEAVADASELPEFVTAPAA